MHSANPKCVQIQIQICGNCSLSKLSPKWFLALYAIVLCCLAPLRPLWLDEVIQLSDTYHHDLLDTINLVAHNPGGVPLTYIVQNLFVNVIDYPFYAARLLSVLWAFAAMSSLIWLARLLHIAWLPVALCYALLPISLRYAIEIRQYGPAMAFSIAATALLVWLDREPSPRRAVLYACVLTLGLYSHPYFAFVVIAHALWALRRTSAKYALPACAASGLLFLPWFLIARVYWTQAVVQGHFQSAFTWKTPLMIPHELSGGGYLLTCSFLALAAYGYWRSPLSTSAKQLLLLCILVPLPLVMFANILFRYFFAIRQLVFIVPPLSILAAEGVRAFPKRLAATLSAVLVLFALYSDFRWFHQP